MLETIVPSRIRRTLLEHIVTHPADRFYLRGLAKQLQLSVSPLRRELKRLEQLRFLKAYDEANIRFYVADQSHPLFVQLQSAVSGTLPPAQAAPVAQPEEPLVVSTVISHPQVERLRRALRPRIFRLTVLSALTVSLLVILGLGGLVYLGMTNHRLLSLTHRAVEAPRAQVTVVEAAPRASGAMQGSRWRLVPGGMGGFSAGAGENSL